MLITYVDENEFTKRLRALRKYCMRSYKEFIFKVLPSFRNSSLEDGNYRRKLITEDLFSKVYGDIELVYSVQNGVVLLENLEPNDALLTMYSSILECYKGVPIINKKAKIKVDILSEIRRSD